VSDLQSLNLSFLWFSFLFYFILSFILGTGVRVLVWHHCHNYYKSHDIVTVIVTNYEKEVKGSEKISLYSMYNIYQSWGKHMAHGHLGWAKVVVAWTIGI